MAPVVEGHAPGPEFGGRLSREEYERRVLALHTSRQGLPDRRQAQALRRAELELLIDYRLGTETPARLRDALWERQASLDRSLPWRLLLGVIRHPFRPSDALARTQVKAFSKVLSFSQLGRFFDLNPEDLRRLLG